MKAWTIFLFPILLISCDKEPDPILGQWRVSSKFYRASYQITEVNDRLQAQVLYYNDGTTLYTKDSLNDVIYFAFTKLKKQGEIYVDGISGASNKSSKSSIEVKPLSQDTLEVTTSVAHQNLTEIWIRKH